MQLVSILSLHRALPNSLLKHIASEHWLQLVAFAVMASPADMLYQRTFWLLIGAGLAMLG